MEAGRIQVFSGVYRGRGVERGGWLRARCGRVLVTVLSAIGLVYVARFRSIQPEQVDKPNVVILLVDDLSWSAPAFQGNPYTETPHLDRLAAEGTVLSAFYGCSTCRPARVALLTGCYPARLRVFSTGSQSTHTGLPRPLLTPNSACRLPRRIKTLATVLRNAGYATGAVGKWQVEPNARNSPRYRGFTESHIVPSYRESLRSGQQWSNSTAEITDWAIQFVRRHRRTPFFLYVAYHAVHAPLVPPAPLRRRFELKDRRGRLESPEYAAMLAELDHHLGRLLRTLADLQLQEKTVVVFTSDNGGAGGYEQSSGQSVQRADNRPLRSGKGTLYEGGIRVPAVVRWPGRIRAGQRLTYPAHLIDLMPTLLSLLGVQRRPTPVDGTDLSPLLLGRTHRLPDRPLFWYAPTYVPHPRVPPPRDWRATPCEAVRIGPWKLLHFFEDDRLELYNLQEDIAEQHNLASAHVERATALLRALDHWRASLRLPVPRPRTSGRPTTKTAGQMNVPL